METSVSEAISRYVAAPEKLRIGMECGEQEVQND